MKILFLSNRLPHPDVAGSCRLVHQRIEQLVARGHVVGLASLVSPDDEKHVPGVRKSLHEVETAPVPQRKLPVRMLHDYISVSLPAIFWKNYSHELMRKIGDMVERTRYDVVVAEFSEMGMYLYRNPYLSAVKKVVSCHRCLTSTFSKYIETAGVPVDLRLKSASQLRVVEQYEFEMYQAMDHILTLTAEDRFTLLHHAPQLPISVIPPGIDTDYLDREPGSKPNYPVITMCGYFSNKSNHDGALWFAHEIWPLLKDKFPTLQYYIVGQGANAELRRLNSHINRIVVTGSGGDLRPYREMATIFINPMRLSSGLRIKALEAMATQLPVVSTSLGVAGIPAQNGINCFIADTPQLFADSIAWLLNDPTLAQSMGSTAKQMVQNRYSLPATIGSLEQTLEEVIAI